jgi:hypothetical protein
MALKEEAETGASESTVFPRFVAYINYYGRTWLHKRPGTLFACVPRVPIVGDGLRRREEDVRCELLA